jgi:hypothetical protein
MGLRSDPIIGANTDYPAVLPLSHTGIAGTFEQANELFQNFPGLHFVLCVAVPDCLWVTTCAQAFEFFSETAS